MGHPTFVGWREREPQVPPRGNPLILSRLHLQASVCGVAHTSTSWSRRGGRTDLRCNVLRDALRGEFGSISKTRQRTKRICGRKPNHIKAGHRCFEVARENRRVFYFVN